ncbi:MAG: hypothetical protein V7727_02055 [Sneathiella sp.]
MPNVGDIRWQCWFYNGTADFDEYHLRTIRGGQAYFVKKSTETWVKKSKKHFDWGWSDFISHWNRETVRITKPMDYGSLRPNKHSALLYHLRDSEDNFRRGWFDENDEEDYTNLVGLRKYVKRNAKRLKGK